MAGICNYSIFTLFNYMLNIRWSCEPNWKIYFQSWTGHGILDCYGHFETTADFGEGTGNGGDAEMTCRMVDWNFDLGLGPEAMFFKEDNTGEELEVFAVISGSKFW